MVNSALKRKMDIMLNKIDPAALVRHPRARRWAGRLAILLAVIGVLGFLVVPPMLKAALVGKLSEALHREVTVGSFGFNPYTLTVTLENVSVREKDGAEVLGFDSLAVNAELVSLAVAGVVVKEIELSGLRANLTRTADKRYNISDLIDEWMAKPKDGSPMPRFSVSNIQIHGGRIEFDDRPEGVRHVVSNIALQVPFVSSLSYYADVHVEPLFSAMVNDSPLVLLGKSRPFADSHESEVAIDLDDLKLAKYLAYSPVDLPIRIVSGELDSELRLRFVQTKGQTSTLSLAGRVALKDLKVEETGGGRLAALHRLEVLLHDVDLLKQRGTIEKISLDRPEADLRVDKQGRINWLSIPPPSAPADGAPQASLWQLALAEFRITDALVQLPDTEERFGVGEFEAHDITMDAHRRFLAIGDASMRKSNLRLLRDSDGRFAWLRGRSSRVASAAPAEGGAAWQASLGKFGLEEFGLTFSDRSNSSVATQTLEVARMEIDGLSTDPDGLATLSGKLQINRKGELALEGTVRPVSAVGEIRVEAAGIDLLPLQPYFSDRLNIVVTRGQLAAKGSLRFAPATEGMGINYSGDLTLGNFSSVDKANSADFLKWRSFYFGGMNIGLNPLSISIGEVALSDFYSRLIVSREGKLNLAQIVRREPAPESTVPTEPAPSVSPAEQPAESGAAAPAVRAVLPVKIGKVTLQGGNINFSDNFVKPNYSANLTRIGGRVTGLSSAEGSVADLELRGSYNDQAPVNVMAKLNPFAARSYLDLSADVKGVEMTSFSAYAGKYAGYEIEKGKLSLFLKYRVDNNQLAADNRILLDQLTFGDPVESDSATRLPVTLAVSLLKNGAGEIDINLPISGSLDNPEFSLGGIIGKVILNIFVKAVTSPFALLGALFGGGEELAYVEFDYGYDTISEPMRERLTNLAKVLEERPSVQVSVAGRIDPERDREGLKRATMERRVRAQKLADLVKKGVEIASANDVKVEAKEYPLYLERAYQAEKFPKPRNIIGLVKDLPVEEMEKLMIANMPSDDETLRELANRRAESVVGWLVRDGKVAAERVFQIQPHLAPKDGPQNEKAKESRVDFLLK